MKELESSLNWLQIAVLFILLSFSIEQIILQLLCIFLGIIYVIVFFHRIIKISKERNK